MQTATAAAYGILTVADTDDVAARLTAGRLLQHIHLGATAGGLGLQEVLGQPGQEPLVTFRLGRPVRTALRGPRRAVGAVPR